MIGGIGPLKLTLMATGKLVRFHCYVFNFHFIFRAIQSCKRVPFVYYVTEGASKSLKCSVFEKSALLCNCGAWDSTCVHLFPFVICFISSMTSTWKTSMRKCLHFTRILTDFYEWKMLKFVRKPTVFEKLAMVSKGIFGTWNLFFSRLVSSPLISSRLVSSRYVSFLLFFFLLFSSRLFSSRLVSSLVSWLRSTPSMGKYLYCTSARQQVANANFPGNSLSGVIPSWKFRKRQLLFRD